MKRELTPENIQELKENQIFVFGSNMNGNHAGGAARLAVEKFGAIMGRQKEYKVSPMPFLRWTRICRRLPKKSWSYF